MQGPAPPTSKPTAGSPPMGERFLFFALGYIVGQLLLSGFAVVVLWAFGPGGKDAS